MAIRRRVALAQAVFDGRVEIEDINGILVVDKRGALDAMQDRKIPILIDPLCEIRHQLKLHAIIDARMLKNPPELGMDAAPIVIGLGPGFEANVNCHAVIETMRGHHLGRVYWEGQATSNTAIPESVSGYDVERVIRAPISGILRTRTDLGSIVRKGDVIAEINGTPIPALFDGVLRGLVHDSLEVKRGDKIGDLDPRSEPSYSFEISDKALAVGGGALEALLSYTAIREALGA
jgi:xanthine dehydrogenase accessory factor